MSKEYASPTMIAWANRFDILADRDYEPATTDAFQLLELLKTAMQSEPSEELVKNIPQMADLSAWYVYEKREYRFLPKPLKQKVKEIKELVDKARFDLAGIRVGVTIAIYGKEGEVRTLSMRGGNCTLRDIATGEVFRASMESMLRSGKVVAPESA